MTILTFKPANQQETYVVHNYLRKRYTEMEFQRATTFLHSVRLYNKCYQVIIDTIKKEFEWINTQSAAWTHIDCKCATITKLMRFVDPKGWDVISNAMDIINNHVYVNGVYVGEALKYVGSKDDAHVIFNAPDDKRII